MAACAWYNFTAWTKYIIEIRFGHRAKWLPAWLWTFFFSFDIYCQMTSSDAAWITFVSIYDRALIQSKLSMNPMSRNVFPSLWRLLSFWIASIATFHHSNIHLFLFYFISGVFRGGHEVLLRAKLALAEGVTMQLTVRTTNAEIAELVTSAIGW